eukprot:9390154-Pyramimonas_sp.AAC.1
MSVPREQRHWCSCCQPPPLALGITRAAVDSLKLECWATRFTLLITHFTTHALSHAYTLQDEPHAPFQLRGAHTNTLAAANGRNTYSLQQWRSYEGTNSKGSGGGGSSSSPSTGKGTAASTGAKGDTSTSSTSRSGRPSFSSTMPAAAYFRGVYRTPMPSCVASTPP